MNKKDEWTELMRVAKKKGLSKEDVKEWIRKNKKRTSAKDLTHKYEHLNCNTKSDHM